MVPENDPHFMLGVISGKIDLILLNHEADKKATAARFDKAEARLDDIEDDVATLKQGKSWLMGGAATIAGLVSFGLALLGLGK